MRDARRLAWALAVVAGLGVASAAQASDADGATLSLAEGRALADKNRCLGCHEVNARRVGPPFTAVAKRFRGQPEAAKYLAQVIRQGSSGQWGAIPMPAQSRLSPSDALALARWVLSLGDR